MAASSNWPSLDSSERYLPDEGRVCAWVQLLIQDADFEASGLGASEG